MRGNMLSAVTEHYVGNWSSVPVAEMIAQLTYVLPSTTTKLYEFRQYMLHVSVVPTVIRR
jgi:hypothetical protein